MSIQKIGDYIHYRYENYRRYGVSVDGPRGANANEVFQGHAKVLKRLANQQRANKKQMLQDLEQQLNFFFNPKAYIKSVNADFTEEEIKNMQNAIKEIFADTVHKLNPNIDLDEYRLHYGTLNAWVKEQTDSAKVQGVTGVGQGKTQNTWTTTVANRIKILIDHYNYLQTVTDLTVADSAFLKQFEVFTGTTYKGTIKELEKELGPLDAYNLKPDKKHGRQFARAGNESFLDELNNLLAQVKINTASHIKGMMAEYIPAITQYVLANKIEVTTEDILNAFIPKDKLVGSSGSVQRLDTTAFIGGIKAQKENTTFKFGNKTEVQARVQATQDKVDVILDIPNSTGTINASVKNYNLKKYDSITLQSGNRPLTYFIQDYPLFVNHYLNITAAHPEGKQAGGSNVSRAHNLMKLTIATHALAGAMRTTTGRQKTAEILIINDSSTGGFKVYYIADLISKLHDQMGSLNIEGYNNPVWENDYIGERRQNNMTSAYARIANLLAQVHQTNITKVSMSTNVL